MRWGLGLGLCLAAALLGVALHRRSHGPPTVSVAFDTPVPVFEAYGGSLYRFDREYGFRYIPGARVRVARVSDARVIRVTDSVVNADGNIGDAGRARPWERARRVLVVGDSFTANPARGGITWTDWFGDPDVAVLNLGRDGYSIFQMVHLAAREAPSMRPTDVVVAFIGDDLDRARFWRSEVDGRLFTTPRPETQPPPELRAEGLMMSPLAARLGVGDPAEELVARYRMLRAQSNPNSPARNPRHNLERFTDDEEFVRDTAELTSHGARLWLVRLPIFEEIRDRRYRNTSRGDRLVASLRASLPSARYRELLEDLQPPSDPRTAFLLPEDMHPSALGARMYGEAMMRALAIAPAAGNTH